MKEKTKKILSVIRVIKNVVLSLVIAALAGLIIVTMITRFTGGTPSVFGYAVFRVSSGSMEPELAVGDVILNKKCDPMTLKEGDIVTYNGTEGAMNGKIVTHRLTKEAYEQDGEYYIETKGDANPSIDPPVNVSQVSGVMVARVDILSVLYGFFITPWGLLTIIMLIILAFFNEIVIFVRALLGYNDNKKESVQDIIERYQKENRGKSDIDDE